MYVFVNNKEDRNLFILKVELISINESNAHVKVSEIIYEDDDFTIEAGSSFVIQRFYYFSSKESLISEFFKRMSL